jgi:hypothetical protein
VERVGKWGNAIVGWYENLFALDQRLSDVYIEDVTGGGEENSTWYLHYIILLTAVHSQSYSVMIFMHFQW